MTKPTLAEQLRLAADIVEKNLPWEYFRGGKWTTPSDADETVAWAFTWPEYQIRIKPGPEMVPLEPCDVPPGSAIRQVGSDSWGMVTYKQGAEISVANFGTVPFSKLHPTYEIKRPGEDWRPCAKERRAE